MLYCHDTLITCYMCILQSRIVIILTVPKIYMWHARMSTCVRCENIQSAFRSSCSLEEIPMRFIESLLESWVWRKPSGFLIFTEPEGEEFVNLISERDEQVQSRMRSVHLIKSGIENQMYVSFWLYIVSLFSPSRLFILRPFENLKVITNGNLLTKLESWGNICKCGETT